MTQNEKRNDSPSIKLKNDLDLFSESCRIVADTFKLLEKHIKPGIETIELDRIAEDYILSCGARPAFKGYRQDTTAFPNTLCISIDEQVVHGIPSSRKLEEGMIVSIDCGCEKNGYFGDSAVTYAVGNISEEKKKLLKVTEESLFRGIEAAVENNKVYDISRAVQSHVEANGFSVTRELVGHGVGRRLHMEPPIPNFVPPLLFRNQFPNMKLRNGMGLAIEPMVHAGRKEVVYLRDGWTVLTKDGSPSAHFEHTVVVNDKKAIILTLRD